MRYCGFTVAHHFEQMGANSVEAMMAGDPRIGSSAPSSWSPLDGPCTIAAAMAHQATMGLSDMRMSSSYSARICGQSVSWSPGFVVHRGNCGLKLVGADGSFDQGRGQERNALGNLRLIP